MGHDWPLFALRLVTPRLVLTPLRESDMPEFIEAARSGIHDPAVMPFATPWTDVEGDEFVRNSWNWFWNTSAVAPDAWQLRFGVRREGRFAGVQDLNAKSFPARRLVETGSWLRGDSQGQGFGKEMRAAVLTLAFAGLGAEVAASESFLDNPQSGAVSRALGYEEDGHGRHAPRGTGVDSVRWRLTKDAYERARAAGQMCDVSVEGLDGVLPLLGLE